MEKAQNDAAKLGELIKDIRVAMLTTVDKEGRLHSRPMATQQTEFDGTLWFFTDANSVKVHELQRDRHVNVSYANPEDQRYVSVSGMASTMTDRGKMEELWSPLHKAWFPKVLMTPILRSCESMWIERNTGTLHLVQSFSYSDSRRPC